MNKGQIRQATQLWIAKGAEPEEDYQELVESLETANSVRDQMLEGKMTVDDFLDCLASLGIDMDAYEDSCSKNLQLLGLA